MGEILFLWFLPMIFSIILLVYVQNNLEEPLDNFWIIVLSPTTVIPILNLIVLIVTVMVAPIIMGEFDMSLKDTKLNRFLFKSKFKYK